MAVELEEERNRETRVLEVSVGTTLPCLVIRDLGEKKNLGRFSLYKSQLFLYKSLGRVGLRSSATQENTVEQRLPRGGMPKA